MSAEIELMFLVENIKDFFNKKNEQMRRIHSNIKRNIEVTKKDTEKLKTIPNALQMQKEEIRAEINEYIKYFAEINENKIEEYELLLKKLDNSSKINEILDISLEASDTFEEYKYEEEMSKVSDEELVRQYVVSKMKDLEQEVHFNKDGLIIGMSKDKNIVAEIGKDNIKVDILGKSTECVKNIRSFEKSVKNEMKKGKSSWHSEKREKELKRIIEDAIEKENIKVKKHNKVEFLINNIYDEKLISKNK